MFYIYIYRERERERERERVITISMVLFAFKHLLHLLPTFCTNSVPLRWPVMLYLLRKHTLLRECYVIHTYLV